MSGVSDMAVSNLILEMENYLRETELPDFAYLETWNGKFHAAIDMAEKGDGWKDIVDRAHALGDVIQKRLGGLNYEKEQLRQELNVQAQGQRALKGYSSALS